MISISVTQNLSHKGVFGEIHGYNDLLKDNVIEYIDEYKIRDTFISDELSSNNRVGVFVVKDKTKSLLEMKIRNVLNNIEVKDTKGENIMNNDVYIQSNTINYDE